MNSQKQSELSTIDRRQCVTGLSAAALSGLLPQSVAAGTVASHVTAPALGNVLAFPAPSDAALFLQAYLQDKVL